jgi:hypothetical protein
MRFALLFFTLSFPLLFACEPSAEAVDVFVQYETSTGEAEACPESESCSKEHVEDIPSFNGDVAAAQKLLQDQGYFVAQGVKVLDRPEGFPEEDEFPLKEHEFSEKDGGVAEEACRVIAKREAPEEWYKPIFSYCRHRIKHSSRAWQLGKKVASKIDGTPVHDRDRSSAHYFYKIAVKTGRMNPKVCPHHRLPELFEEHPPGCIHLSQTYEDRFKVPLNPERRVKWLANSHAYEKFGARGDADWNAYHCYKAIGGCYPFTAFDRTDVAATAIVRRSMRICAKYGCANTNTISYIKPHWNEAI